jgi:3-deoxy-D-manno-octulosonate 8-phosphate phosphatase (KDO 8-P phosphatase)
MDGLGRPGGTAVSTDALIRARGIRLLTCDVDGVLTDGKIYVDDLGHEMKAFSSLDGVAMHLLGHAGIIVAWITGSPAPRWSIAPAAST